MVVFSFVFATFAIAWMARRTRWAKRLCVLAATVLFLACWPPTVWVAIWLLERPYAAEMPPPEKADVVVVLAGYLKKNDWGGEATLGLDSYERLIYAEALHRHWPDTPIIVTGGRILGDDEPAVATVMAKFLVRRGVPEPLIEEEAEAKNTHENAINTAARLNARGLDSVVLVTEARHMRRAVAVFEKQGLRVVPAACCLSSTIDDIDLGFLLPNWWSLQTTEGVIHEVLGFVAYRLKGRI